jgi:hypothetical protein
MTPGITRQLDLFLTGFMDGREERGVLMGCEAGGWAVCSVWSWTGCGCWMVVVVVGFCEGFESMVLDVILVEGAGLVTLLLFCGVSGGMCD